MPGELGQPNGKPCFLPDRAGAEGFECIRVDGPRLLPAGIATTGPLARSLFFLGFTEEQALVANVRNKGLVVITGCGHPLARMQQELDAEAEVFKAGRTYRFGEMGPQTAH